ncbi:vancomycin resistance protein [bacterium 1XD21-13]|nr:vancomycin resistance protein [bacterium 1XD21-13]
MKRKASILITMLLCFCLLWGSIKPAEAAQMPLTSLTFDVDYYYNTYPDLQAALSYNYNSLYQHYLNFGLAEGRSGSAEFNCLVYRNNYPDLQAAFGNNYSAYCAHYENYGKAEGRSAAGDGRALAGAAPASATTSEQVPASTLLGSYATAYNPNISRATNIALAASRINGVVVQPGESFSFSQTILPRTPANGYVTANVIVNKKYVPGTGGGICQVSSTLYAAMLSAGLPATERHSHSLNVGYIPVGMDATISGTALDLKFTNIFSHPIQIQATANQGTLTIGIYKL